MTDYSILRVNLSDETIERQDLPTELIGDFIGGKGIGTHLLLKEVDPSVDPLDSRNEIIFVVGPLTGTSFPTANRYGILFKSPLTGTYAESYSGGGVGIHIRNAGYFAITITGRAEHPVYLHITDEGTYFRDARDLWGMDTFDTTTTLQERHGNLTKNESNVVCIGPAGENLVRFASVQNNFYHSAGRCGAGAVLGSKNLKALVFEGDFKPTLQENPQFKALIREIMQKIQAQPMTYGKEGSFQRLGTIGVVEWTNALGCFPTRYFTSCQSEFKEKFDANAMSEILLAREGCRLCPFPCGKLVKVTEPPFQCEVDGPEYETVAVFGGVCDIQDIRAIAKINEYCDRVGLDTISAGDLCGLGIEAKMRGRISSEFKVDYNDPENVLSFLEDITYRRGLGEIFADGAISVTQYFHLEDIAMHVKGLDFAGYDPRAFRGFALSYGVSPEGATHLRSCYFGTEIHQPDRFDYENKVDNLIEAEDKMVILDSLIVCKFLRFALDWESLCNIYETIFNRPINVAQLRGLAGRIVNLSREFNIMAGFRREDDYLPDRVYNEPLFNKNGVEISLDRDKYNDMLDEYYAKRGWTHDGVPDTSDIQNLNRSTPPATN